MVHNKIDKSFYLLSHDERHKRMEKVELCHGHGDRDLEQSQTSESSWDKFL